MTDRGDLRLWDLSDGQQISSVSIDVELTHYICSSLIFSPDGKRLAATFRGTFPNQHPFSVCVWEISRKNELTNFRLLHRGESPSPEWGLHQLAFSPDSRTLASHDRLWEMNTLQQRLRLFDAGVATSFAPDRRTLPTVDLAGAVQRRDAATGEPIDSDPAGKPVFHYAQQAAFAPDGSRIALVDPHTLIVKDVVSGACLGRFEPTEHIQSVLFSPDGRLLVVVGHTGSWMLDGSNAKVRSWFRSEDWGPVAFRDDGQELVGLERGSVVARAVSALLASSAKAPPTRRTEPEGVPLEVEVVANQDQYVLDLEGQKAEAYSKRLFVEGRKEPPAPPEVDLVLKVRNTGKRQLTISPDFERVALYLVGDAAINLPDLDNPFGIGLLREPEPVPLAAGETRKVSIDSLKSFIGSSWWLTPGEYSIRASYHVKISPAPLGVKPDKDGFGYVTVRAAPIKVTVREAKK